MAKQTFTTGQVLTAAQMTSLQQTAMGGGAATAKTASYVLVAADAGTTVAMNAAGATTITVNTGLFAAGDTVFIQNLGAGACTVTAGTATVATAGSLILPQNDAGILYFTSASAAIFYDYIQVGATSPLTTKGDLYTFSTSDARLPVGSDNSILVADSSESVGMKWATPSGGLTLLSTTTLSGATTTISSIPGTYTDLYAIFYGVTGTNNARPQIAPNGTTTITNQKNADGTTLQADNGTYLNPGFNTLSSNANNSFFLTIFNYASTSTYKGFQLCGGSDTAGGFSIGVIETTSAITSLVFSRSAGDQSAGTVLLYGVK